MRKCNGYWSKEKCKEIAVLYSSRSEFNRKDGSAYVISRKNGWLDEICNHMIIVGNRMKRCIYAIEFLDNYVYIGLSKWLEDICSHMENNGRLRTKNGNWNKENCQIEALKYKTKTEFTKKCSGAYLSSSRNG